MNDQRKTKKQLLEELERERERSIALQEVSNKVTAAHDTGEVLDLIVNEAARLVGATAAFIRLLEDHTLVRSAATKSADAYVADIVELQPTLSVGSTNNTGQVMATKQPKVLEDSAEMGLASPDARLLLRRHDFHGTAYIPLLANDRSIGVLQVYDKRPRLFTDDEVSLLTAFADQASLALEKARLLDEAQQEKERAETEKGRSDALNQVSNRLAGAHDTRSPGPDRERGRAPYRRNRRISSVVAA